jgi:4-amino-4-deoxy-L-arabinose transferase-like glycosyltransferase
MQKYIKENWFFILLIISFTALYYFGLSLVPFHPDESTHIFMSQDTELLFTQPLSLSWEQGQPYSNEIMLRSLGAPLTKYLIGLSRLITNVPQLAADWNWSLSWDDNIAAGSLPSQRLLLTSRATTTFLLPFALIFLYTAIKKVYFKTTAIVAVIFLGLNPLLLLHGRRAMNEAAALLGICFFIWAISQEKIRPWLLGLTLAIAFAAKQATIALLPIGIIAVCKPFKIPSDPNSIAKRFAVLCFFFAVITYSINPFFWRNPIQSAIYSHKITTELKTNQLADYYPLAEDIKKQTLPYRTIVLFANLYLSQPRTADVGNYLDEIKSQETAYFNFPLHNFGRRKIPATVFLVLSFTGFILGIVRTFSHSETSKSTTIYFLLATTLQFFGILFFLPLPWQRYIIPLLPFSCIWASLGLTPLLSHLNYPKRNNS